MGERVMSKGRGRRKGSIKRRKEVNMSSNKEGKGVETDGKKGKALSPSRDGPAY